ncbi:TPA: hypothetical protein U2T46_000879 [Burkholderia cenocepacia]|nr:hypothetical protein [Burkholderia cenocepacia]
MKATLIRMALSLPLAVSLAACSQRDGHVSATYYGAAQNDGDHVAYGSVDVRLFEMTSPDGHRCTVLVTDNNHGGVAMHCWGAP